LSEIPPAIAKLSNLTQLNLSQNRLRSLPAELVQLFDLNLKDLVLYPNAFLEPESPFDYESDENNRYESTEERLVSHPLGRTPLQISDSIGQVLSTFRFPAYGTSNKAAVVDGDKGENADDARVQAKPSRVPSLVEMALRTCYSTNQLSELPHYIPEGLSHLRHLLERAVRQKGMGGIACTNCKKSVIMPPIEWVEWREIRTVEKVSSGKIVRSLSLADDERAVPFLHRGCSWKCGPVGKS
jgi:hypothetical protein